MEQRLEPLGGGIEIYVSDNHKFGTDAILLSRFCEAKRHDRAIDLGTGCGIIPFLWCRNNTGPKEIFAVEIQAEAFGLCCKSIEKNSLENSFKAVNSDIRELQGKVEFGSFSLVTCNPPYKKSGAGILSETESDKTARHETTGELEDFISVGSRLLQTSGRFCMCLRPERLSEAIVLMSKYKVEPKRLRFVAKTPDCKPWLFLIEGKKCAKQGLIVLPELFIHNPDGSVSGEMEEIYGCYRENAGAK